ASEQDFLLVNLSEFLSADSREFMALITAASKGQSALFVHLLRHYGLFNGLKQMARLQRIIGSPFAGFAAQAMNSIVPVACGPYAAKVRVQPQGAAAAPKGTKDWGRDLADRLTKDELRYDLQLQFFTDEATTPIEDASKPWLESASPFVTVARLTVPAQS